MKQVVVTAVGKDRPGIVAAVTKVILDLDGNLADCSMSLLGGQFAMILLVHLPAAVTSANLEAALEAPASDFDLLTNVTEIARAEAQRPGRPYVLSVYGADKPGIVHAVAKELADRQVNITDLVSHLINDIFTMVLDVDLPEGVDTSSLALELKRIGKGLDVEVDLRSSEIEEL